MFLPSLESVILHTGFILSLVAVLGVIIKHRNIWREKTAGLFLWLCLVCVCVFVCAQSSPTLCDPMDCSLSGSSVHGILQARILKWVAISSSRGSS